MGLEWETDPYEESLLHPMAVMSLTKEGFGVLGENGSLKSVVRFAAYTNAILSGGYAVLFKRFIQPIKQQAVRI